MEHILARVLEGLVIILERLSSWSSGVAPKVVRIAFLLSPFILPPYVAYLYFGLSTSIAATLVMIILGVVGWRQAPVAQQNVTGTPALTDLLSVKAVGLILVADILLGIAVLVHLTGR